MRKKDDINFNFIPRRAILEKQINQIVGNFIGCFVEKRKGPGKSREMVNHCQQVVVPIIVIGIQGKLFEIDLDPIHHTT